MTSRCDPVPSGGTPTSSARARRLYSASSTGLEPAANSTHIRPKLFTTARPWSTENRLVAATSGTPSRSTISSTRRVAGPVSFFAEVATFQIVPSGARTTPP